MRSTTCRAAWQATMMALAVTFSIPAHAKDFCIDSDATGGNPDYIAFNFVPPKPGKCRPFVGVQWPGDAFQYSALHGVACARPGRLNLAFTLGHAPNLDLTGSGETFFVTAAFALPGLTGVLTAQSRYDNNGVTQTVVGSKCDTKIFLPIPK